MGWSFFVQKGGAMLIRVLLVMFFASSVWAQSIDFGRSAALNQWLKITKMRAQYLSYDSSFENGGALAVAEILRQGKWVSQRLVTYVRGEAWPVSHMNLQVDQNPFKAVKLPTAGTHFVHRKGAPDQRLLISFGKTNVRAGFNLFEKGGKARAEAFIAEIKALDRHKSIYHGRVLEFKPTGLVGFLPGVDSYNYGWKSIVIENGLKTRIQKTLDVFLQNYDYKKWKSLGLPLNRGVLLYGPPGTGKSLIAKILISNVLQNHYKRPLTYIHVQARHVAKKDAVVKIYNIARLTNPSIVFIEDVDLIAGTDRQSRQVTKNELMQQLSGIEKLEGVMTIATTNLGSKIDPALKRSKRLGYHFHVGLPASAERLTLFKLFAGNMISQKLDYASFADLTEKMTGADIELMVQTAAEMAIRDGSISAKQNKVILQNKHVLQAVKFLEDAKLEKKGVKNAG